MIATVVHWLVFIWLVLQMAPVNVRQIIIRNVNDCDNVPPPAGCPNAGSLVSQGMHPRTAGLSSATIPTIAAKINAYYDDDPTTSYAEIVGSFGDAVDTLDAAWNTTATRDNGLLMAHAYCFVGHILPYLTTGGTTGINPDHTATEYGQEGARLAAAVTDMLVDTGFDGANGPYVYDWCYNWLNSTQRSTFRDAMDDLDTNCYGYWANWFSADSHKNCSAMFAGAVAVAGDGSQTWGATKLADWESVMASNSTGIIGSESTIANLYKSAYGYGTCSSSGLAYMNYMWAYDVLAAETYRFGNTTNTRAQFYDITKYGALPSGVYCVNNLIRPYARTLANGLQPHDKEWLLMRTHYTTVSQVGLNQPGDLPYSVFSGIWNEVETAPARLAMWIQRNRRQLQAATSTANVGRQWVYRWALEDPTIAASSPSTLNVPLSARHGDGQYWFKSAWDTDSATNQYWSVKITLPEFNTPGDGREYFSMSGAIEVYRKGPQLIIRGASAHTAPVQGMFNTLYFYDANRTSDWANTGTDTWSLAVNGRPLCCGANQPQSSNRGADIVQGGSKDYYPTSDMLRHRFSSGNATTEYIYADRKNSYPRTGWFTSTGAPAHETEVITQFIVFRPPAATGAARIARLEVVTNTSNTYNPLIAWNPSTDSITVNGTTAAGALHAQSTFGHLKSTNSSIITASNAYDLTGYTTSGRNTLTIVHPTAATVVIAGGLDETGNGCTFSDTDGAWSESTAPNNNTSLEAVDIYGFRHPHNGTTACNDVDPKSTQGRYFATVSHTSVPNGTRVYFLLFYETDDNGSTAAAVTALTGLTNFVGFQWTDTDMNGIALFGENGVDQTSGNFTIPTAGTYRFSGGNLTSPSSRTFTFSGSCGSVSNRTDGTADDRSIDMTITTTGANCAVTVG